MAFAENPEAYVARILSDVFRRADSGEFDEEGDPFPLTNELSDSEGPVLPEDRVYPNFQPIDPKGIDLGDQIRLLLPAVVYQPVRGLWEGNVDPEQMTSGLVRLGNPKLIAQSIQIDIRDQIYPRIIKLGDAVVEALIAGQRAAAVSGPTFDYSQVPGEADLHRRIYSFTITA